MRWITGKGFVYEAGEAGPGSQVPSLISALIFVPRTKEKWEPW